MSNEQHPDSSGLPSESDFVEYPEWSCLDQRHAWRTFGGLTLEEAKAKFAENSIYYQEDFMWMGTNAFAFYFPVVDWWLRSVPEEEESEHDSEAWVLAQGIEAQFDHDAIGTLRPLIPAVLELAAYVLANVHRFGLEEDRRRVAEAWTELAERLRTIAST